MGLWVPAVPQLWEWGLQASSCRPTCSHPGRQDLQARAPGQGPQCFHERGWQPSQQICSGAVHMEVVTMRWDAETHFTYTVPYRTLPQSCSEPLGVLAGGSPQPLTVECRATPATSDCFFPIVILHGLGARALESITWVSVTSISLVDACDSGQVSAA